LCIGELDMINIHPQTPSCFSFASACPIHVSRNGFGRAETLIAPAR
jgi:hypothetical protein